MRSEIEHVSDVFQGKFSVNYQLWLMSQFCVEICKSEIWFSGAGYVTPGFHSSSTHTSLYRWCSRLYTQSFGRQMAIVKSSALFSWHSENLNWSWRPLNIAYVFPVCWQHTVATMFSDILKQWQCSSRHSFFFLSHDFCTDNGLTNITYCLHRWRLKEAPRL